MTISRSRLLAPLLGCALAAGCADRAPTEAAALPSLSKSAGGSGQVSFTVYPNTPTTVVFGDHKITFDKDAVCDPTRSKYGPGEWRKPCDVAKGGTRITARWSVDSTGQPTVDFQPAVRFNPASEVTLYLMDKSASAELVDKKILYLDRKGTLLDEAALDGTVATHLGPNGFLYRRLRHFSGYIVTTRSGETPSSNDVY